MKQEFDGLAREEQHPRHASAPPSRYIGPRPAKAERGAAATVPTWTDTTIAARLTVAATAAAVTALVLLAVAVVSDPEYLGGLLESARGEQPAQLEEPPGMLIEGSTGPVVSSTDRMLDRFVATEPGATARVLVIFGVVLTLLSVARAMFVLWLVRSDATLDPAGRQHRWRWALGTMFLPGVHSARARRVVDQLSFRRALRSAQWLHGWWVAGAATFLVTGLCLTALRAVGFDDGDVLALAVAATAVWVGGVQVARAKVVSMLSRDRSDRARP